MKTKEGEKGSGVPDASSSSSEPGLSYPWIFALVVVAFAAGVAVGVAVNVDCHTAAFWSPFAYFSLLTSAIGSPWAWLAPDSYAALVESRREIAAGGIVVLGTGIAYAAGGAGPAKVVFSLLAAKTNSKAANRLIGAARQAKMVCHADDADNPGSDSEDFFDARSRRRRPRALPAHVPAIENGPGQQLMVVRRA